MTEEEGMANLTLWPEADRHTKIRRFLSEFFATQKSRKYSNASSLSLTFIKRFSKYLVIKVSKILELHSCMSK